MESELLVKDREIVVPGEEIAKGMDFLPSHGTYRLNDSIYAKKLGIIRVDGKVIKLTPLTGAYMPKANDVVVGQITEILSSGWFVNFGSPYRGMMPIREASADFIERGTNLARYFDIGDIVALKITNVTPQKMVDLSAKGPGLRRLRQGRIIKVCSNKVPRIIGKQGSMITLIKEHTKTQIVVGQNGTVWISGEDAVLENLAEVTVKKIEKEAHTAGLTAQIEKWLVEKTGGKKE